MACEIEGDMAPKAPNNPWLVKSLNDHLVAHEIEGDLVFMALDDPWSVKSLSDHLVAYKMKTI